MTTDRKHRCGGILREQEVFIRDEVDRIVMVYRVPGLVCDRCGDELIDRDTMVALEKSQTPTVIWDKPATSQLEIPIFPESASTVAAAA